MFEWIAKYFQKPDSDEVAKLNTNIDDMSELIDQQQDATDAMIEAYSLLKQEYMFQMDKLRLLLSCAVAENGYELRINRDFSDGIATAIFDNKLVLMDNFDEDGVILKLVSGDEALQMEKEQEN